MDVQQQFESDTISQVYLNAMISYVTAKTLLASKHPAKDIKLILDIGQEILESHWRNLPEPESEKEVLEEAIKALIKMKREEAADLLFSLMEGLK